MSMHNITVANEFDYIFKGQVEISDVIEALQGYEYFSTKYLPEALRDLLDGEVDLGINLYLKQITHGSLKNKLLYDIFFKTDEDYVRFIDKVRKITGIQNISEGQMRGWLKIAITAILTGSAISLIAVIANQIRPGSGDTIINDHSTKVEIVDSNVALGFSGKEILGVIEHVYESDTNKKESIKNVQKVLAPTQKYGGDIQVGDHVLIPEKVANEVPKGFELKDSHDFTENMDNIRIEIRATDVDHRKKGWGVTLPDLNDDKRVRMEIDPNINLHELSQHKVIYGSIVLHKTIKSGDKHSKITKVELINYKLPGQTS